MIRTQPQRRSELEAYEHLQALQAQAQTQLSPQRLLYLAPPAHCKRAMASPGLGAG
ncbi:hypothetical protein L1047_06800 [Synechococcus sp. Nb3U1]|uniref:hypothetical protein n=1 Tax=Synechococcus sp. Nb3U1 TaxID=1914529 RepID=UPI001F229333|nr:hypothetical protein [Synechococcus sp. Nb3U1]MCF2970901.1 hypothetical protein [Synechococcus sp. Nb3U1]